MRKQTKLIDYGTELSFLLSGTGLEDLDVEILSEGCHSMFVEDSLVIDYSGVFKLNGTSISYSNTVKVGDEFLVDGKSFSVSDICFPFVIVKEGAGSSSFSIVSLVCSYIRGIL